MQQITEEEYAMKFCMLIILDERKVSGMDRYTENFKYILESYRKIIKGHPGLVMQERGPDPGSEEYRGRSGRLRSFAVPGISIRSCGRETWISRCFSPSLWRRSTGR